MATTKTIKVDKKSGKTETIENVQWYEKNPDYMPGVDLHISYMAGPEGSGPEKGANFHHVDSFEVMNDE